MPLEALFFDFDGLIVDTETPEVEVWTEIFAEYGLEYPQAYWSTLIGAGPNEVEERPMGLLQRMAGVTLNVPEFEADLARRHAANKAMQQALPGVVELAREALAERVHTAVVSSSRHQWVDGYLDRLGIASLFERTVCRDDVTRAKPFPDLYLRACELFEVHPRTAIALEDSANGAAAAVAAGVFVVAVPNPTTSHLDLSHANAHLATLEGVSLSMLARLLRE